MADTEQHENVSIDALENLLRRLSKERDAVKNVLGIVSAVKSLNQTKTDIEDSIDRLKKEQYAHKAQFEKLKQDSGVILEKAQEDIEAAREKARGILDSARSEAKNISQSAENSAREKISIANKEIIDRQSEADDLLIETKKAICSAVKEREAKEEEARLAGEKLDKINAALDQSIKKLESFVKE